MQCAAMVHACIQVVGFNMRRWMGEHAEELAAMMGALAGLAHAGALDVRTTE